MRMTGKLSVRPVSRLLIGGHGARTPDLDDGTARMVREEEHGSAAQPYLPATALKGALRETLSRLVAGAGEPLCPACREGSPIAAEGLAQQTSGCSVCAFLGTSATDAGGEPESLPARVVLTDAHLSNDSRDRFVPERHFSASHHVSVDRRRRTRSHSRLFGAEVLAPFSDLEFEADVTLDAADADDWKRLQRAFGAVLALGSGKTAGCGRVDMRLSDAEETSFSLDRTGGEATEYVITLLPRSPLVLGGAASYVGYSATMRTLPGSTMRGALAHEIIRLGVDPGSSQFSRLFLDDRASRFEDCLPVARTHEGSMIPRPMPTTAYRCKKGGEDHGLHDTLALDLLVSLLEESGASAPVWLRCPEDECEGRLERVNDVTLVGEGDAACGFSPSTVARTGVAMGRRRGKAAHGLLHTLEQIRPGGTVFVGVVRGLGASDARSLESLEPRVGKATSRGLGRCEISLTPLHREGKDGLEGRIDAFQKAVDDTVRPLLEDEAPLIGRLLVPLLCASPWPVEEGQTPQSGLAEVFGVTEADVCVARYRLERRGRYETRIEDGVARGRKTGLESVVRPGSVFLLSLPNSDRAGVLGLLRELEDRGFCRGEEDAVRRACGQGAVVCADPFHTMNNLLARKGGK